jgi:hypothetical protein
MLEIRISVEVSQAHIGVGRMHLRHQWTRGLYKMKAHQFEI